MKKNSPLVFSVFFIMACCFSKVTGQNLVLNPSFQNFSSCPQGISQFNLCTNWSAVTTPGSDTCSTPDLYATCSSGLGGVNIPNCLLGTHQAYTGTGMAGQILGDGLPGCIPTGDNYREYIEGSLSSPLVAGQKYLVAVYMSLADQSMWGSNSYGIYFTNTQYSFNACNTPVIPETPQLEMCGPAIMDTVNWVPVQWIYTATGGERFMTLGNFKNDANTNRVTHNCGSFNPYIYYYIGLVSVTPVGPNECGVTLITDSVNSTCGTSNGSVAVTAQGCTSPFTYAWSTSATTATIQNVGPGTYTVTVTDATNCKETTSVSVNSKALSISSTGANPACGTNTGTASASVSNGTGPYTYAWSNGGTTDTISNLGAGNYYVTVTGASGCLAHDSVSLFSSSGLSLTTVSTAASCGSTNGSAVVNVTGGAAPFSYNWSNGQTTQTASNLAPGTYTVTVMGDTSGSGPFWTENFTSGGTGWTLNTHGSGTNGSSANQWVINSDNTCVCGSGNYLHITNNSTNTACLECVIMPAGTCQYLELASTFMEGDFTTDVLAISPIISTVGKSNITLSFNWESLGVDGSDYGLVDLSNNGGATWTALPFQYVDSQNCSLATVSVPLMYQNSANFRIAFEWKNGPGSFGQAGNPPGFVIDNIALTSAASNCPATASVVVPASGGLSLTFTPVPPSCGIKNGSIQANVTGADSITYSWNTGATSQGITSLGAGIYSVTASSPNGCSVTGSTSLFIGSGGISALTTVNNTSCANNNGSASVSATGSTGYSYLWSNGGTTASISNIAPGNYTVTVTAAGGGCTTTASALIDTSTAITLATIGGRAGCTSSGTSSVNVTEGNGPFSYLWSNGATTSSISALSAGNYTVTVTGAASCTATATSTVITTGGGVTLSSSSTASGCADSTGSASVTTTSGTGPFTYAWSNGGTSSSIQNVAVGNYTVTVTAGSGCSATSSANVTGSGSVNVTTSATATSCGNSNGTANVTNTGGGNTYTWSNGATTASVSNLSAGTYTVTVVEGGACSGTGSVVINASGTTISIQAQPAAVCQGDTSQICAPAGYSIYHWNIGASTQCISVTQPGSYYLTVTDNGNCTATSNQVTITVNTPDSVSFTQRGDSLIATNASSYQWYFNGTAIAGATSQSYIATQDGNYYVEATDANGCHAKSRTQVVKNILGINQLSDVSSISVYPNPLAGGSWHLDVTSDWIGSSYEIYDAAGRLIYRNEIRSTQSELELNIAQGIYLMRINSAQKNYSIKLIKL